MEERIVLSSADPVAQVNYMIDMPPGGQPYQSAGPTGFTPQQIQTAYGISQLYGIIGNGTGQTIAIVDAYDDPDLVDSTSSGFDTSDLYEFDKQFGLPNPPSFLKLNETGGTTLPGTDPAGPGTSNWEGEEALDVEWAHAIAPGANIILFEASSPNLSDLLTTVATAADYPGVSVVSMSWGDPEFSGETSDDSTFTTPAGHQPVTFVAASGDQGSYVAGTTTVTVNYPAASPNVLGVGGTSLTLTANNSYSGETAWGNGATSGTDGGSGGGISQYEPEPAYQESVQNTGMRTIPDVAFDADPNTGVSVYDSYNNGTTTPWDVVGGTSLATPCWASLIAIADEGRANIGKPTLDGATQTLPLLYQIYKTSPGDFHDITSGSNGAYSAGPGYDEVTGMGSPVANLLIPTLVGTASYNLTVNNTLSTAAEGQPLTNVAVANFTDTSGSQPLGDYTATITWGDGATSTGTVVADGGDNYTVLGSHTYINTGTYALTVTVQNNKVDITGTDTTNVNVSVAPLVGSAQALNTSTASFVSNGLVAVFVDTESTQRSPSDFSATIEWNEGAGLAFDTTGIIEAIFGNTFAVYGNSPYTFPFGGLYSLPVMIRNNVNGATITVNSVVNVANSSSAASEVSQDQSNAYSASATFVTLEDALTNLLGAERLFMLAFAFGTTKEENGAFNNFVNALTSYETAVFNFDMQLPGA